METYEAGNGLRLRDELYTGMMDAYIVRAFAARKVGVTRNVSLVVWAAQNKNNYLGWHDEIANIRTLFWEGFDASTPEPQHDPDGLHCMV